MTSSRRMTSPVRTATPGMRIYFAGASGAIGSRLVPLLVHAGHTVGAMTRSPENAGRLASMGAQPIVCDVFDRLALTSTVRWFSPDLVLHELTDLPDDLENLPEESLLNARIRVEGTRNLLDAMKGLEQAKIVAQSVAWTMNPARKPTRSPHSRKPCSRRKASSSATAFSTGPAPITSGRFPRRRACTSTPPPLEPSKRSTPLSGDPDGRADRAL